MNICRRQRGASSLGILFMLFAGIFIVTCALKLIPVYIEGATVSSTLQRAIDDGEFDNLSIGAIKRKIGKYFEINRVEAIKTRDVKVTRDKGKVIIDARYEHRIALFSNIDVVVKFDQALYEFRPVQD